MTPAQPMPVPGSERRDEDGRLVGLAYDSTPALPAGATTPWLIAIDRSDNALRAVAHAAAQLGRHNAHALHLVQVQSWLAKEAAESLLAPRALDASGPARRLLDEAGLPWRLHVAMGEPAETILDTAKRIGAAGIVIGSRGMSQAESLLFGSVAYKVIHLSPVPVLVVP